MGFDQSSCLGALVRNQGQLDVSNVSSLALVEAVRQSSNSNTTWDSSATVLFKGVPFTGEFDGGISKLETYVSELNLNWSSAQRTSIATQTLSKEAVRAYEACIGSMERFGPTIYASDATKEAVTITVAWRPAPNTQTDVDDAEISIENGEAAEEPPTRWVANMEHSFVVRREEKKDIRVIANIGNDSDELTIFYLPEVRIERQSREILDAGDQRFRVANQGDGREQTMKRSLAPTPGWMFDPNTASVNELVRAGAIDERTEATITDRSPWRIEVFARCYPLAREQGGDLQFSVSVDELRLVIE